MTSGLPLSKVVELLRLGHAEEEIVIVASPGQRIRLAEWAGVNAVDDFEALVVLKKVSSTRFDLRAEVTAVVVQSCVVTLEPVRSQLNFAFSRELHHLRRPTKAIEESVPIETGDDAPEEIDSTKYDVAAPLLEEFALALDPYPRAPGAIFESGPEPPEPPVSPFAVLKDTKT